MSKSSPTPGIGDDLPGRLDRVFVDRFARTRSYSGRGGLGYYGVRLERVATDGTELDLILTFRAGEEYCCSELGCHCELRDAETWSGLRELMDDHGLGELPLPTIRLVRVVIEDGATFTLGRLKNPPLRSRGFVYEHGPFNPVIEEDDGATSSVPTDG